MLTFVVILCFVWRQMAIKKRIIKRLIKCNIKRTPQTKHMLLYVLPRIHMNAFSRRIILRELTKLDKMIRMTVHQKLCVIYFLFYFVYSFLLLLDAHLFQAVARFQKDFHLSSYGVVKISIGKIWMLENDWERVNKFYDSIPSINVILNHHNTMV